MLTLIWNIVISDSVKSLGANDRDIITDKQSGKNLNRDGYNALKNALLRPNDTLVGLSLNMDRTLLKCYMGDTGLLISHTFDENGIVSEEIYIFLFQRVKSAIDITYLQYK
jgi:hypothetical protein